MATKQTIKRIPINIKDGYTYYCMIVDDDFIKRMEKDMAIVKSDLGVAKFTSKYQFSPFDIIVYGEADLKKIPKDDRKSVLKALEGAMPLAMRHPVHGEYRTTRAYKCWCCPEENTGDVNHKTVFDSFECLMTYIHRPKKICVVKIKTHEKDD